MGEQKYKLLIVDDSKVAAFLLNEIAQNMPEIEVVGIARSGEEAIEMYKTAKPDLVSMDLIMTGMGGIEAIKQIIKIDPKAKIIVVSSVGGAQDKLFEALEAGAVNVISKPYEEDKVVAIFKKVLGIK